MIGGIGRAFGRSLVRGMPVFLTLLSVVGTAAMIWVGGGIVLHGLEVYGPPAISHAVEAGAEVAVHALPSAAGVLEWAVVASISGLLGLLIGAVLLPAVEFALAPAWKAMKAILRGRKRDV
jgi:predicted DNA repair protein MutK